MITAAQYMAFALAYRTDKTISKEILAGNIVFSGCTMAAHRVLTEFKSAILFIAVLSGIHKWCACVCVY